MKTQSQAKAEQNPRLKVMLLLWSLQGGGAERIAVHLLNRIDRRRFNVKMGLLRESGPYLNDVDPSDLIIAKGGNKTLNFDDRGNHEIFKASRLVRGAALAPLNVSFMLRKFQPDVVLSFCKGMNLAAMAGLWLYGRKRTKWIAREGNNTMAVIEHELQNKIGRWFLTGLTKKCYRSTDCLLSISKDLGQKLQADFHVSDKQSKTIYNAVDLEKIEKHAAAGLELSFDDPFFLGVGRLEEQKGFDTLIEAFSKSRAPTTHRLVLLGKGPEEERLRKISRFHGIENRVHIVGWTDNPWAWLARAKAFVLSSRWEGFGNVVIEALACKTPVIVTDCDFGPKEIIRNDESGLVVPVDGVAPMANAISRISEDDVLSQRLTQAGYERAKDFAVEKIVHDYESLFLNLHN